MNRVLDGYNPQDDIFEAQRTLTVCYALVTHTGQGSQLTGRYAWGVMHATGLTIEDYSTDAIQTD